MKGISVVNNRCAETAVHRAQVSGGTTASLLVVASIMLATPLVAHEGDEPAPIVEVIGDVGDVDFEISCVSDGARQAFNRGIALLHHMTYEVAEMEFSKVAKADANCAIAHWGIAMTLIHPVWPGKPTSEVLERGTEVLARAATLRSSVREKAYIDALGAFYRDWRTVDHSDRIRRWSKAQTAVFERYPDDDDALAFAALLSIAAAPKDDLEFRFNREAGAQLEQLLARRPRHAGAVHYLIHAYDNPPLAEKALAAARSYGSIAPDVPHALHMPSHIFTRLGFWMESVEWNIRSREASRHLALKRHTKLSPRH